MVHHFTSDRCSRTEQSLGNKELPAPTLVLAESRKRETHPQINHHPFLWQQKAIKVTENDLGEVVMKTVSLREIKLECVFHIYVN